MEYSAMDQYWIWLSSVDGIGPKRFYQLLSLYEDARGVWDALGEALMSPDMQAIGPAALANLRKARDERYFYQLFDRLERLRIRAVTRISDDYPPSLSGIYDPPPTLYVRGDCPLGGERTIAVLGCGVDICYPPENERLMAEILDTGGAVISELVPGTTPMPGNFPARNRIISGLSEGTLLVEGARASGAMITVNLALEQGRDVFAVPGGIYSPLSDAPNRMILDGAIPVLSHWDILEHYRWAQRPSENPGRKPKPVELSPEEQAIVEPLREQALSFDELALATGFSAAQLNSHLTMLELRGIIEKAPGGLYRSYC